jgi:MYXO-CTERM domain-containing protein
VAPFLPFVCLVSKVGAREEGEIMKKVAVWGSAIALALLLTGVNSALLGVQSTTSVAFAQDGTAVPTAVAQAAPVQTTQPAREDNNDFPWGLLGLLGLAGLAGMRRQPEPVRREPASVQPTVGMYDSKK